MAKRRIIKSPSIINLRRLPKEKRAEIDKEIIRLRLDERLELEQIGKPLGLNPATVGTRIHRLGESNPELKEKFEEVAHTWKMNPEKAISRAERFNELFDAVMHSRKKSSIIRNYTAAGHGHEGLRTDLMFLLNSNLKPETKRKIEKIINERGYSKRKQIISQPKRLNMLFELSKTIKSKTDLYLIYKAMGYGTEILRIDLALLSQSVNNPDAKARIDALLKQKIPTHKKRNNV